MRTAKSMKLPGTSTKRDRRSSVDGRRCITKNAHTQFTAAFRSESGIIVADENGEIHEIAGDFYEKGQEVIGGWAKVYHKKRSHPIYRRIRLERFNKGFGQWTEDAAGMICKCAEADALRST